MTTTQSDNLGHMPRYALFRGRRSRIIRYEAGKFTILDRDDQYREVTRDKLTFLKPKKKK